MIRLAMEAGADYSKEREEGMYTNLSLYKYTKAYHEYQVKRMKKIIRQSIREALEEALKHHNVEVIR
jgi:hypothetical protein